MALDMSVFAIMSWKAMDVKGPHRVVWSYNDGEAAIVGGQVRR